MFISIYEKAEKLSIRSRARERRSIDISSRLVS
jgi:hypothetical protein